MCTFAVDLSLSLAEGGGVDPLVAGEAGEAALVPGLAGSAHQLGQVDALLAPGMKNGNLKLGLPSFFKTLKSYSSPNARIPARQERESTCTKERQRRDGKMEEMET